MRALAAALLILGTASAAGAQGRVAISVDGTRASRVASVLTRGLVAEGAEVVAAGQVAARASRDGYDLASSDGFAEAADAFDLRGYAAARVTRRGRTWVTRIVVRGADGGYRAPIELSGDSFQEMVIEVAERAPARILRVTSSRGSARARPARRPERGWAPPGRQRDRGARGRWGRDDREDEEDGEDEDRPRRGRRDDEGDEDRPRVSRVSPLTLGIGVRGVNRKFFYVQDSADLAPYVLPLGPAAELEGVWYPGAHVRSDAVAHIGLRVGFSRTFLLQSGTTDSEVKYDTSELRVWVGARARMRLGPVRAIVDAGLYRHGFRIEVADPRDPAPAVPSVAYMAGRVTARLDVPLPSSLELRLSGGYALVFDRGEIGSQNLYPDGDARGFSVGVGVARPFDHGVDLHVGVEAEVYRHDLGSESTGGAVDRYLGLSLGVGWDHQPPDR